MNIGYARVSTAEQDLSLQKDALIAADCKQIYTDTASRVATNRPGLEQALAYARDGDTVVVWRFFSALAEFERDLIKERTMAGLKAARARGRCGGRPRLLTVQQIQRAKELYQEGNSTVTEICKVYNISAKSFYNYLKKKDVINNKQQCLSA